MESDRKSTLVSTLLMAEALMPRTEPGAQQVLLKTRLSECKVEWSKIGSHSSSRQANPPAFPPTGSEWARTGTPGGKLPPATLVSWQPGLPAWVAEADRMKGLLSAAGARQGWACIINAQRKLSHGMMFSKCLLSISRVGDLM